MLGRIPAGSLLCALTLGASVSLVACASESSASATKPVAAAKVSSAATQASVTEAQISDELKATAQVIALDKTDRLVTLRGSDGRIFQIMAPAEVRNFDQIEVGDSLKVTYRVALSAKLLPPGESQTAPAAGVVAARAKPGEKPGVAAGAGVSVRVQVESVDPAHDIVVCKLASGELVAHKVATPEGRAFVKHLKPGDLVQLDYAEAMAVTVEEMPAGQG